MSPGACRALGDARAIQRLVLRGASPRRASQLTLAVGMVSISLSRSGGTLSPKPEVSFAQARSCAFLPTGATTFFERCSALLALAAAARRALALASARCALSSSCARATSSGRPEPRHKRSAARASKPPCMRTLISNSWSRWRRNMKCNRVARRKQTVGSKNLLQTAWRIVAIKPEFAPSPSCGAERRQLGLSGYTPRNEGLAGRQLDRTAA